MELDYNAGIGEGAFDCDEAFMSQAAKLELQEIMFRPKTPAPFTKKHYPGEPNYLLYQNTLMATGMPGAKRKQLAMARYAHAKKAKVGDTIVCPGCGKEMKKTSYQHVYCKEKIRGRSNCKDFINNWFDPTRLMRTVAHLDGR